MSADSDACFCADMPTHARPCFLCVRYGGQDGISAALKRRKSWALARLIREERERESVTVIGRRSPRFIVFGVRLTISEVAEIVGVTPQEIRRRVWLEQPLFGSLRTTAEVGGAYWTSTETATHGPEISSTGKRKRTRRSTAAKQSTNAPARDDAGAFARASRRAKGEL